MDWYQENVKSPRKYAAIPNLKYIKRNNIAVFNMRVHHEHESLQRHKNTIRFCTESILDIQFRGQYRTNPFVDSYSVT